MGKIFNLPLSSSRIDAFVSRTQYPHEKLERVLKFSPKISVISSIGKTINEEAQLAGANQKTKTKITSRYKHTHIHTLKRGPKEHFQCHFALQQYETLIQRH